MFAFLARPPACRDFKFCDDARDAAASPARNIAEGFGRRGNKQFANFVTIAHGSQVRDSDQPDDRSQSRICRTSRIRESVDAVGRDNGDYTRVAQTSQTHWPMSTPDSNLGTSNVGLRTSELPNFERRTF